MKDLEITDRDGDTIRVSAEPYGDAEALAFLTTTGVDETSGGLYLTREDADRLRTWLNEALGEKVEPEKPRLSPAPEPTLREQREAVYRKARSLVHIGADASEVLELAKFLDGEIG